MGLLLPCGYEIHGFNLTTIILKHNDSQFDNFVRDSLISSCNNLPWVPLPVSDASF